MRIGFLGPRGTFSQEALNKYIGRNTYEVVAFSTIPEMLFAVKNNDVDEAVVPIENSIEGGVGVTLDMMAFEVDLLIKAELAIQIRQNLLAKKGTRTEDIKCILSHPQAIGQCRKFINSRLPHAEVRFVYSTADAAQEIAASGRNDYGAIGSIAAAEEYKLDVLASSIQDRDNNLTRFVVISKEDSSRTGSDKTSIVFSTEDKPGSLYRILDIFSLWDINLTRIESRPEKNELGRYIFFVDFVGHRDDEDVRDALAMVKRKTSFYKFLGSYPKWKVD